MNNIINTKILLSGATIVAAAALIIGATYAFFSDTETSENNVFVAGALDLKIDSEAHYNGLVCRDGDGEPVGLQWLEPLVLPDGVTLEELQALEHYGDTCVGTWAQTDLDESHQFFSFADLKPGDLGENTISLHVLTNDAWGRFTVENVVNADNTCAEPEEGTGTEACTVLTPELLANGELGANVLFDAWLDQGGVAGFQCNNPEVPATAGARCAADPLEGDNILNGVEALFWTDESVDEVSEGPFDIADVLAASYDAATCTVVNGDTDYGACHGLADDGRMVGSATYYFGLGWSVLDTAGNEIQTDSLTADMVFEVEQHRNNPTPFLP